MTAAMSPTWGLFVLNLPLISGGARAGGTETMYYKEYNLSNLGNASIVQGSGATFSHIANL